MRRSYLQLVLVVSAAWVGCSSDRTGFKSDNRDFVQPDSGDLDGGLDAGCFGVVCSRDLHSIRDCSGNVVKECAADTACANGACIAPCDAAAINEGSVGCSFAVPGQNGLLAGRGNCRAIFVANNWTSPATLQVDFKGAAKPLDGAVWVPVLEDGTVQHKKLDGPIPPGGGAIVFLSNPNTGDPNWASCPAGVKPLFDTENSVYGTGVGNATFVRADVPVSMYSMFPYGGAKAYVTSGTLLFPTTSFRKNYILASSWGGKGEKFGTGMFPILEQDPLQTGKPTLQIVAAEDETSIDILPKVEIMGGSGIPSGPANKVMNFKLQRGEVLQLTQENELVGSVLESDKPVGVFGGNTCMRVPSDVGACDVDNEQIPPLSAWGHEYSVLPAPDRATLAGSATETSRDPSVIRMVGAAGGTTLVYEPAKPAGAPDTLESGELARFFAQEPFVVRSQDSGHPFLVTVVMTGANASRALIGDPESLLVVPANQWLDTYGFFSDPSYSRSALYVTRRKTNDAFRDVTLECAGVLTGWKPITAEYEWTYVELSRGQRPQTYPGGTCADGAHRIQSEGPFTISMWGLGSYASYSYPGGAGLRPITELHIPVR